MQPHIVAKRTNPATLETATAELPATGFASAVPQPRAGLVSGSKSANGKSPSLEATPTLERDGTRTNDAAVPTPERATAPRAAKTRIAHSSKTPSKPLSSVTADDQRAEYRFVPCQEIVATSATEFAALRNSTRQDFASLNGHAAECESDSQPAPAQAAQSSLEDSDADPVLQALLVTNDDSGVQTIFSTSGVSANGSLPEPSSLPTSAASDSASLKTESTQSVQSDLRELASASSLNAASTAAIQIPLPTVPAQSLRQNSDAVSQPQPFVPKVQYRSSQEAAASQSRSAVSNFASLAGLTAQSAAHAKDNLNQDNFRLDSTVSSDGDSHATVVSKTTRGETESPSPAPANPPPRSGRTQRSPSRSRFRMPRPACPSHPSA